jgi:hypothetical protein
LQFGEHTMDTLQKYANLPQNDQESNTFSIC